VLAAVGCAAAAVVWDWCFNFGGHNCLPYRDTRVHRYHGDGRHEPISDVPRRSDRTGGAVRAARGSGPDLGWGGAGSRVR
jgi:hypothetical protein